jgi:hypothetical protein
MTKKGDVTFRVSPEAQAGLEEAGLTQGQIMEAFERATRETNTSVHEWAMPNSMLTFSAHDKVLCRECGGNLLGDHVSAGDDYFERSGEISVA